MIYFALSKSVCGDTFTVGQALSCKKGGFVAQRHDGIRDLLTSYVNKVCTNIEFEPRLLTLDNEKRSDARLDIKAGGLWEHGVPALWILILLLLLLLLLLLPLFSIMSVGKTIHLTNKDLFRDLPEY